MSDQATRFARAIPRRALRLTPSWEHPPLQLTASQAGGCKEGSETWIERVDLALVGDFWLW